MADRVAEIRRWLDRIDVVRFGLPAHERHRIFGVVRSILDEHGRTAMSVRKLIDLAETLGIRREAPRGSRGAERSV